MTITATIKLGPGQLKQSQYDKSNNEANTRA